MKAVAAMVATAAVALVALSACTKKWEGRSLVGTYHLVNPTACRADVQDSTLVIRSDGTYDQRVQLKSGRNETAENGHWAYDRTARRINFSKFLISNETSFTVEASPSCSNLRKSRHGVLVWATQMKHYRANWRNIPIALKMPWNRECKHVVNHNSRGRTAAGYAQNLCRGGVIEFQDAIQPICAALRRDSCAHLPQPQRGSRLAVKGFWLHHPSPHRQSPHPDENR